MENRKQGPTHSALGREADTTTPKKSMVLADGTQIDLINPTARKVRNIISNKALNQYDQGIHMTAARILVNGQTVVYDDLLDCFTEDEVIQIMEFAYDMEKENKEEGDKDPNE